MRYAVSLSATLAPRGNPARPHALDGFGLAPPSVAVAPGRRNTRGSAVSCLVSVGMVVAALGCAGTGVAALDQPSSSLTSLPTEITLRYGEERLIDDLLRVSFLEVLEDSRCPVDVTCVWAGNARARIGISMGMGPTFPLELNSTLEPTTVDWSGVRVTLLGVMPEPRSTEKIPPEAYSVRLRLEDAS